MLIRSKRAEFHSKATSQDIGPGSYDNDVAPDFKPKTGNVSFWSSTARDTSGVNAHHKTPGPGTYEEVIPSSVKTSLSNRGSSQFAGNGSSSRTGGIFTHSDVPGPGAYTAELVPPRKPTAPQGSKSKKSQKDITWVKVATAPSIPAMGQSHGYEEGTAGELIQSAPPVAGHSGRHGDLPGPGEYDPSISQTKLKGKTTKFTGSASRSDVVPRELRDHPGPGAYQPQESGKGIAFQGGVASKKVQSMFASNSTRSLAGIGGEVPGPGSYKPPSGFRSLREHLATHPESFHAFGSSGKQPHIETTAQDVPGPGAYTAQTRSVLAGHNSLKPIGAFASKTERFREMHPAEFTPGPGGYETFSKTMDDALKHKIHGRFGAFGSTTKRFNSEVPQSTAEPGTYSPSADFNPADARRRDKRSAAFRSRSSRQETVGLPKPPKESDGAGTQYYNVALKWGDPGRGVSMSKTRRFDTLSGAEDLPGPGEYTASSAFDPTAVKRAGKNGTFSINNRFNGKVQAGGPGPGAYNTMPSMVKKTFNITIGDTWD